MAQFDIDKAKSIIVSGDQTRIDGMLADIASHLRTKKYGLVFETGGGSSDSAFETEQVVADYRENIPYPVFRDDLSLNVDKFDGNMLLEGDNYVWLKMLEQTHKGKINVIYIDPPYNTGNDDFQYNDEFVDANDRFRHSKWLSFIEPRLRIAFHLLDDDGFIAVSIDINEVFVLKLLMDDIFGADCFVSMITRRCVGSVTTKSYGQLQNLCDYVLIYKKNPNVLFRKKIIGQRSYPYEDDNGRFYTVPLQDNGPHGTRTARPNLWYPIYRNDDGTLTLSDNGTAPYLPKKHKGDEGSWMWSKNKFEKDNALLTIGDSSEVLIKHYYDENEDQNKYQKYKAWLDDNGKETTKFWNKNGTTEVKNILGGIGGFTYPKPVELVKWLVYLHPSNNATVLDFFAGSGTTAQAVEALNAEDGGTRHWIICTNNENDICRSVTKPRIDTVITGIRTDGSKYSDGVDSSYAYFQHKMMPRTSNSIRNSRSLLVPRIVDVWLMMLHGVRRVRTDETHKAFVYEGDGIVVAALFGDPTTDDVASVLSDTDAPKRVAYVPDGSSALLSDSPDGIDVRGMSSLVTNAYLS